MCGECGPRPRPPRRARRGRRAGRGAALVWPRWLGEGMPGPGLCSERQPSAPRALLDAAPRRPAPLPGRRFLFLPPVSHKGGRAIPARGAGPGDAPHRPLPARGRATRGSGCARPGPRPTPRPVANLWSLEAGLGAAAALLDGALGEARGRARPPAQLRPEGGRAGGPGSGALGPGAPGPGAPPSGEAAPRGAGIATPRPRPPGAPRGRRALCHSGGSVTAPARRWRPGALEAGKGPSDCGGRRGAVCGRISRPGSPGKAGREPPAGAGGGLGAAFGAKQHRFNAESSAETCGFPAPWVTCGAARGQV